MKFCSYCGKEISEETDLCPFCRNPSSHTSKNTKKKKKPGCLIGLVVALLFFILFVMLLSTDNSTTTTKDDGSQAISSEESNALQTYKIGDNVTVHTNRGDYSLKFTGVRETTQRNEFADENPQRVIILEYEYKNISFDSDVVVSFLYLRAYDKDGNALTIYPDISVKETTNISQGKTATASIAYGLDNNENFVTVDFYDITMESPHNPECTFNLTW